MNNEAPASTAALQARIADLEQQLKLSDEGVSRLAQRCLALEQEVQAYLEAHPQNENQSDSVALLRPTLYYDPGTGFSQQNALTAPDYEADELNGSVNATFTLPAAACALRLDPGELPCCISGLAFSDDRIHAHPLNGLELQDGNVLFLGKDPNFLLSGLKHFPAGMKLGISYHYFPLEKVQGQPLFDALLETITSYQKQQASEAEQVQQLREALAAQQQDIAALQQQINVLNQKNAETQAQSLAYENALDGVLNSSSWKLTQPLRRLLSLFRRS